jgi:hypothetical protein
MTEPMQVILDLIKEDRRGARAKFVELLKRDEDLQSAVADDYFARANRSGIKIRGDVGARGKSGPKRRPMKVPTQTQKQAEIKTATRVAISLLDTYRLRDGRVVGDILMSELPVVVRNNGETVLSFIMRGRKDAEDALLCWLISQHCVPPKDTSRVRDCVSGKELEKLQAMAERRAPDVLREVALRGVDSFVKVAGELSHA